MKKKKTQEEETLIKIDKNELSALKKNAEERDEFYNKWLAVHAEYENTRKRMEKEKSNHIRFANEMLIAQLFPIVDNFDMAFSAMEKAEDKEAVMDGIRLVQKEFHRILEDNGVKRIESVGKVFDHNVHEAVLAVETNEQADGMILEELRAGYTLNDRLLRPAQVKVAKSQEGKDEQGYRD